MFPSGTRYEPITVPILSATNLRFETVATAPLLCPLKVIPVLAQPQNSGCLSLDKLKVSIFNIVLVEE